MPTAAIPFASGQASSYEELAGAGPAFRNALVDKADTIRARPGIVAWDAFPSTWPSTQPVNGMSYTQDGRLIYSTTDGKVFGWLESGRVIDLSIDEGDTSIEGTMRPTFVTTQKLTVAVAGGAPQKILSAAASLRLSGSPPDAIDATVVARRLVLAGKDTGLFYWSGILEPGVETWDTGIEFREAETRADNVVAVRSVARELFVFGTETVQGFAPDEIQTFAPSTDLSIGCGASRSIITRETDFAWLDNYRRLVLSDGRALSQENVLSEPIQRDLEAMERVDDAWGFRLRIGNHDCLVWVFPTGRRTFVVDMTTGRVGEWSSLRHGRRVPWLPTAYLWWPAMNLHLVGLDNGQVAKLSMDAHTDLGDAIEWRVRSGFVSRDVGQQKFADRVHITARRGSASDSDASVGLQWRDGPGTFDQSVEVALGAEGEAIEATQEIAPVGPPYVERQWELYSTAAEARAVTKVVETFTVQEY